MIEIVKQVDDLTVEVWRFIFLDRNLYLNEYRLDQKESKRNRKYTNIKKYDRLYRRDNNVEENDAPLPDWVKNKAHELFTSKIKVLKWNERQ